MTALVLTKIVLQIGCLLSVIETCRLRQINPWKYLSCVIQLARQGLILPAFLHPYVDGYGYCHPTST